MLVRDPEFILRRVVFGRHCGYLFEGRPRLRAVVPLEIAGAGTAPGQGVVRVLGENPLQCRMASARRPWYTEIIASS
jgi:hypothetical protein